MTIGERIIARNLYERVTFLPGSYDKRFARRMYELYGRAPQTELTSAQRAYLFKLLHKYRRQMPETYQQYQEYKPTDKNQKYRWPQLRCSCHN